MIQNKILKEVKGFELSLRERYGVMVRLEVDYLDELNRLVETVNGVYKRDYFDKYVDRGIKTNSRLFMCVRFRNVYCYMAREMGFSFPAIGSFIGRTHSTVIHCDGQVRKYKHRYTDLVEAVRKEFEKVNK